MQSDDQYEYAYICGRCNIVFFSYYGMKEAFCPKCGQHSKTPYYSKNPKGLRAPAKEWPAQERQNKLLQDKII